MSSPRELQSNGLPVIHRYITGHNSAGKAILSKQVPPNAVWAYIKDVANFFLAYTTSTFPTSVDISGADEAHDITAYSKDLSDLPGLAKADGTVLRYVDFPPLSHGDNVAVMHKTVSLDYGILLEGSIELELDSGEKQVLQRGDVVVQRATNHAWNNVTPGEGWARMVFVLVAAERKEGMGEVGVGHMAREST